MTIIDDLDPKEMTQDKRDEYAACWISDNAPDIVIDYLDQREAEYRVAIERAAILINLLTVHQVMDAGGDAMNAAGLPPWCIKEGLVTSNETLNPWWLYTLIE